MKINKYISINFKILSVIFSITLLLSLTLFFTGNYLIHKYLDLKLSDNFATNKNILDNQLSNDKKMLASNLEIITSRDTIEQKFQARDREALYSEASTYFTVLNKNENITHLYFIEPDGTIFLRVHDKSLYGDIDTKATFKEVVKTQSLVSGLELGKTGFALRSIVPIRQGGKLLGYVEIGEEINNFIVNISKYTNSEYEVIVGKQYLNQSDWEVLKSKLNLDETWNQFADFGVVAKTARDDNVTECLHSKLNISGHESSDYKQFNMNGISYSCNSMPIYSIGSVPIGVIIYSDNITAIESDVNLWFAIILISSLVICLVSCLISYIIVRRYLSRPLQIIKNSFDEMNTTQDLSAVIPELFNDEIGILARSANLLRMKLLDSRKDLDDKILKRTADLEKINKSMVGREIKMIELKNKIESLEKNIENYENKK